MKNLKIKVGSEAESKEAQELFFKLGYYWAFRNLGKNFHFDEGDVYLFAESNGILGTGAEENESFFNDWRGKEITLQELRDMVNQEQDEPFLTPETTLNDQYAEIEQVRQSGMKFDSNKPRHSLLPKGAINSVIKVLEFGAKKYDADNWQKVNNAEERYYNAAMRHIDSWWNGEKRDPETGIHHLAHAATNLFFLMWFDNK